MFRKRSINVGTQKLQKRLINKTEFTEITRNVFVNVGKRLKDVEIKRPKVVRKQSFWNVK